MAGPADIIASSYPGVPILLDWKLRERAYGELETHQKEQAEFEAEVIVVVTHNGVLDRINYDDARIKLQTTMPWMPKHS